MIWVMFGVFGLQIVFGKTIGVGFLRSLSNEIPVPNGRIPRIVNRNEEPFTYWLSIISQGLLFVVACYITNLDSDYSTNFPGAS